MASGKGIQCSPDLHLRMCQAPEEGVLDQAKVAIYNCIDLN